MQTDEIRTGIRPATDAIANAAQQTLDRAHDGIDSAQHHIAKSANAAANVAATLSKKASALSTQAERRYYAARAQALRHARRHPVRTLAIAFGSGLVLGALSKWALSTRTPTDLE